MFLGTFAVTWHTETAWYVREHDLPNSGGVFGPGLTPVTPEIEVKDALHSDGEPGSFSLEIAPIHHLEQEPDHQDYRSPSATKSRMTLRASAQAESAELPSPPQPRRPASARPFSSAPSYASTTATADRLTTLAPKRPRSLWLGKLPIPSVSQPACGVTYV